MPENHGNIVNMHPAVAYILSRQLPCAILLLCMLGGFVVFASLLHGVPLIGLIASLLAIALNMLAPALIALITFGGGVGFALKVTAMASLGISVMAEFSWLPGIWVFVTYGITAIAGASMFMTTDGIRKSAAIIALMLAACIGTGLAISAASEGISMQAYMEKLVAPFFSGLQLPDNSAEMHAMLTRSQTMVAHILPGLLAWGMWATWWGNIVLARTMALRYGFYQGAKHDVLSLSFGKPLAYLFILVLTAANFGSGDIQFLGVNAALLVGGLLAVQGIVVVHSWFKARHMQLLISLMYLMLFVWSAMIVPFVIVGLMDIWFDFRRKIDPAHGGQ